MDLSQLSDADLHALSVGDLSKMSNEGLAHLSGESPNSRNAEAALDGFGQTASFGYLPQLQGAASKVIYPAMNALTGQNVQPDSYVQERDRGIAHSKELAQESPSAAVLGKAGGIGAGLLLPGSAPKSILGAMGTGAGYGAAYNPGDVKGVIDPVQGKARAVNAGLSALLAGAVKGGTSAIGKAGDVAMQVAVGRNKYTPGVGTELANAGVVGTRGMMQNQVARGLDETGERIGELASQIPEGAIDAGKIGSEIGSESSAPLTNGGISPAAVDQPKIDKINEFANDVSNRGQESGSEALGRRIAAGQRSYNGKEDPLQSLIGQMSKKEQIKYSQALKAADQTGELASADATYGALKRADKSLSAEASLPKSLMGLASLPGTHIPGVSAIPSVAGQLATKASQAVPDDAASAFMRALLEAKRTQ